MHTNFIPAPTPETEANVGCRPRSRRQRWRVAGAAALVAWLTLGMASSASASVPSQSSEPIDPTPAICLSRTTLTKFTARGGPFEGGTQLSWSVSKACSDVVITLGGNPVAATGSTTKDPLTTTEYQLYAFVGQSAKFLGAQVALGGDIVGYSFSRGGPAPSLNPTTPDAAVARQIASTILGALSPQAERHLLGKTLQIHIIPGRMRLTDLPLWSDLRGVMTCEPTLPDGTPNAACVDPRPWEQVRGVGGKAVPGTAKIATAVGQEQLTPGVDLVPGGGFELSSVGFILAHELGHTVLDFAARAEHDALEAPEGLLGTNGEGHDYVGVRDRYISSTPGEYFAEGTAALFGFEIAPGYVDLYTREWLAANDPGLLEVLRRVYPGAS